MQAGFLPFTQTAMYPHFRSTKTRRARLDYRIKRFSKRLIPSLPLFVIVMSGCGSIPRNHQPGPIRLEGSKMPGAQVATTLIRASLDALGSELAGKKDPPALGENPPKGPVIHRYLEEGSHVQVRRFLNPWLVSDHSKLHLIDQRIAYVGGMNFGWE
jgi:phosphatidylserine/phosphatidylglycerophosphate/cardiolipin synthase-like enzyme